MRSQMREVQRNRFVRQRVEKMKAFIESVNATTGTQWMRYMHRPEIQWIIVDARKILYYSPYTEDYSIWLALLRMYDKVTKTKHL